MNEDKIKNSWS